MTDRTPDFSKAFRDSLGGINADFEAADKDLHEVVAAVSKALLEFSSGALRLELDPREDDESGRWYDVDVHGETYR